MGVIGNFVDPIISTALQKKREEKLSPDIEDEDTLLQYLVRQTSGMSPSSEASTRDQWNHRPQVHQGRDD